MQVTLNKLITHVKKINLNYLVRKYVNKKRIHYISCLSDNIKIRGKRKNQPLRTHTFYLHH